MSESVEVDYTLCVARLFQLFVYPRTTPHPQVDVEVASNPKLASLFVLGGSTPRPSLPSRSYARDPSVYARYFYCPRDLLPSSMASLHVPSLKAKDFSTPSLPLIDGHHSLERMAVDWIALFTTLLSDHMCRRARSV